MPERDVKVLILRFSSLGDIVMATPMIRCVRKAMPNAQIDMVVRQDFLDLIRHNPHLDRAIGLPRRSGLKGLLSLLRDLNSQNYDVIYDAHRSLRTLFLMPFLKGKKKFYYQKHYVKRTIALTFKLRLLKTMPRMMNRYIEPLEPLGVVHDGKGPEVVVTSDDEARALKKVPLLLPQSGGSHIAFIPSAQWPGKRWPTEKFRALAEQILRETPHSIVVFGGKDDTFCQEILKGLPPARAIDAQGKLSILESGALLKHCRLTIANDTGLMHLADALQIPSVLFLGPTSAELGCLPFTQGIVLEHSLWCRPCSKNGEAPCIRRKRYCLELTTPEMAFDSIKRLTAAL